MQKLSVVAVSDTHNRTPDLPGANLLIHSGDLTEDGFRIQIQRQLVWLEEQRKKFDFAAMIFGNHDLYAEGNISYLQGACAEIGIVLLHNDSYILPNGLKIWGSPHTPNYHDWAFMLNEAQIADAWEKIPQDTDILITHGPPKGILDRSYRGESIGCPSLLARVKEINPMLHVFGHAHEGRGEYYNGKTLFVNAATDVVRFELALP